MDNMFKNLLSLDKTIAAEYLSQFDIPWQALYGIKDYIISLGKTLPKGTFMQMYENVWVSTSATIDQTVHIEPPCIIDEGAEIRHCAYIRGAVIIGKNAVVGNSTELKNCILFDGVQVPHFNYIGDSILGYKAHLGAGAVTSNVKSDKSLITVKVNGEIKKTGLKKFGSIIGDNCEIGCNAVLCPGTILGKNVTVYPLSLARGYISENSIFKKDGTIITKK